MKIYTPNLFLLAFVYFTTEQACAPKILCSEKKLCRTRDTTFAGIVSCASYLSMKHPAIFARTTESLLFSLSQLKAKKIFWQAYDTVPAYKKFVDMHTEDTFPETFDEIPVTSKEQYIKKYPLIETLKYATLPDKGQIDTSTGTSGKPTKWVRGHQEMENVKSWIRVATKVALGDKPFIFCNMFALGPWATGMTSAYALTGKQLILSIGPDNDKLYDALQDFGPERRYVIAGYPPHMKKFVDNAPFDLKKYDITMVVGGEAMSENVHASMLARGVRQVYSSYGASDIRINMGQQTEFEQELQKICRKSTEFKKDLLGTLEGTPLFFHYNPLLDYIEETQDGRLLFTDLDSDRSSPRIRYDLGDKGHVLKMSLITQLLAKHKYTLRPRTNLPLICLYGRGDDALTFNGANIMYDDLERALVKIPGLYEKINRYAYNKFETKNLDSKLEFWLELKEGVSEKDLALDTEELNKRLIDALCDVNQDFKSQIGYLKNTNSQQLRPQTFVYEFGASPMVQQSSHHKNKYVYDIAHE